MRGVRGIYTAPEKTSSQRPAASYELRVSMRSSELQLGWWAKGTYWRAVSAEQH